MGISTGRKTIAHLLQLDELFLILCQFFLIPVKVSKLEKKFSWNMSFSKFYNFSTVLRSVIWFRKYHPKKIYAQNVGQFVNPN